MELSTAVIDAGRQMPALPPAELTDAQAVVWRDVIGSLPGGWLTQAAHPILVRILPPRVSRANARTADRAAWSQNGQG